MSRAGELGNFLIEAETGFAENVATMTYALATLGPIDISNIRHVRAPSGRTVQGLQEGTMALLGTHLVEFSTKHYLPGHGSAAATAITDVARLLGYILGNNAAGIASQTATGGTATVPLTSGANGGVAGSFCWCGIKNDARGNGRAAIIGSHAGSSLTLLTALLAAMNNGDAITFGEVMYPSDDPASAGAAVPSLRCRLMTANLQVLAHGVIPQRITFSFEVGKKPSFEVAWKGAWFEHVAATYPDVTAKQDYAPAPIAGGEFFYNNVGTATRQVKTVQSFSLSYDLGIEPKMGTGGVSPFQEMVGATRTWRENACTVDIEFDSEAATTTPADGGSDTVFEHALFDLNGAAAGQRVAVYFPQLCRLEDKAPQIGGKVNKKRKSYVAYSGLTTTTELTKSCFRLGFN